MLVQYPTVRARAQEPGRDRGAMRAAATRLPPQCRVPLTAVASRRARPRAHARSARRAPHSCIHRRTKASCRRARASLRVSGALPVLPSQQLGTLLATVVDGVRRLGGSSTSACVALMPTFMCASRVAAAETATTMLAFSGSQPSGGQESANTHATGASGRAALGAIRPTHPWRHSCSPTRWKSGQVRRSGTGIANATSPSRSRSLRSANRRSRCHSWWSYGM